MARRPFVVELAGPAGSGKTTVWDLLTARSEVTGASVWDLPRSLYAASAVRTLPAIGALVGAAHGLPWEEAQQLIRLGALDLFLRRLPDDSRKVVLLDEGPVFAFAWFRALGHRCFRDGRRDAWWRRVLAQWAARLDVIVLLDGADPLLVQRLRSRAKPHPFKERPDQELYEFAAAYRREFEWVIAGLTAQGGPKVVSLRSNGGSPEELATRVLAACQEASLPAEALAPAPTAPPPLPPPTLTKRASLNAAQSLLDYSAKLLVGLVVTPILVAGLGRSLFGVWEMLSRLIGYISATDGRPTEALRLVVANRQAIDDAAGHRRAVGSALVVWLVFLPIVVGVGAVVIWLAPGITKAGADLRPIVHLAAALLLGGFLVAGLAAVPESVLRGMNLGYKRMGLQAGLSVAGGILMTLAVRRGFGLAGVAGSQLALGALTGVCFWLLARRYVPWFGAARPTRDEVGTLLAMSAWLAGGDLIAKLSLTSDVVILGAVVSSAAVTPYVLTGYAARLALGLHFLTVGSAMPGLGGVIGQRQLERAAELRRELLALTWLFATAVGATILLWNRSFLALWVGEQLYAGFWVNLLTVLVTVQTLLVRSDAYVLDAALQPRPRVIVSLVAVVLVVACAVALAPSLGMVGVCLGLLAGRAVQSVAYPVLASASLGGPRRMPLRPLARPALVSALLFIAMGALGERLRAPSWLAWAALVAVSFGLLTLVTLVAGLPAEGRRRVVARGRQIWQGIGGRV